MIKPSALWAALLLFQGLIPCAGAAPSAHVITIDSMRFQPESLVVRPGDRVTWVNKDLVPHTATQGEFDSGNIKPTGTWTFVPRKPGAYHYICTYHPLMKGVLIVKEKGDSP